jgi:ribose 5-phosphate isomerase A
VREAKVSEPMSLPNQTDQNRWKKMVAEEAAKLVRSGMVVGLGTGTTAQFFLLALSQRIAEEGLRISGIPTSEGTSDQARRLNIPLTTFSEHMEVDFTVDGADEVELETLFLIKGHGGALLHEKIVASSSKQMTVITDESKLVNKLGSHVTVPVEVVSFGWEATGKKLQMIDAKPSLRMGKDKKPFVTDGGNYILDCAFGPMEKPKDVAHHLDHIVGVVEHGLFLGFASQVLVGGPDGVKTLQQTKK